LLIKRQAFTLNGKAPIIDSHTCRLKPVENPKSASSHHDAIGIAHRSGHSSMMTSPTSVVIPHAR
jgi:hypothetical protein